MRKLGLVIVALGLVGCGGSGNGSGPGGRVTYPLQGATGLDIAAGDCVIVNGTPEQIPTAATISYTLTDHYDDDNMEVGVVPSSYTCQFSTYSTFIDDTISASATDSGNVPAGVYDLDIICENLVQDCLIDSVTWSATY
ncbi:MAG TPA: hypothetical protein VHO06_08485 [Polyangia bacterium]|nr:hypothetical protein [Polyangia bacterium]